MLFRSVSQSRYTSSVANLYMSILAMEKTAGLLDQNLKNLEKLYQSTSNAVKVGVSEQTDADQISVQVSSMQSRINATKRSLEMLYNSLALQLGRGVDYHITLTQDLTEVMNADAAMELLYTDFNLDQNYDEHTYLQLEYHLVLLTHHILHHLGILLY